MSTATATAIALRRRLADRAITRFLELRARGLTVNEAHNVAVDLAGGRPRPRTAPASTPTPAAGR